MAAWLGSIVAKNRMKWGLTLLALLVEICITCSPVFAEILEAPTDQQYEVEARKRLDTIDVHDGIDRSEAEVIFELYGYRFFLYNGWGPLTDGGEIWLGTVSAHGDDQPLPYNVKIDKKTGAVSWVIGPDVLNYKSLLDTQPNNRFEYAPQGAGPR
jgi:hypothetical protein